MPEQDNLIRNLGLISRRLYRWLLYVYPASFRGQYGRQMAQVFDDELRETAYSAGAVGMISFWKRTGADLFTTAVDERLWEVRQMPADKRNRWTGAAAAAGALLFALLPVLYAASKHGLHLPMGGEFGFVAIVVLSFVVAPLLMTLGLMGTYRRLPDHSRPLGAVALAVALLGLCLYNGVVVIGFSIDDGGWPQILYLVISAGFLVFALGLTGLGALTLSKRSLGRLSFVPLAIAATGLALLWAAIVSDPAEIPNLLLMVLFIASWVLLSLALMRHPQPLPGSIQAQ